MDSLCQAMLAGAAPGWREITDAWGGRFPLLLRMEATEQDPEWHAEGNVAIHAGMVLGETRRLTAGSTDAERGLILQLAAIFHDIGKPLTTRRRVMDGVERITSPRHAEAGRNYLCLRLAALGLPPAAEEAVLALTALHHHPRRLVRDDAPPALWRQLARQCAPELLYALETADLLGRINAETEEEMETLELFRMRCGELGVWENADPWADWRGEMDAAFSGRSPAFRRHAFEAAVRDAEAGVIQSVEEGIARAWQLKEPTPELRLLWGPSGSGKSEWLRRHADGAVVISLDELRTRLAGKRDDQSKNGQVVQAAKELLKHHLRSGDRVCFDATNLRRDLRQRILSIGFDYGARAGITALRTPLAEVEARNRKREHPIPRSVLESQVESLEWPGADEVHFLEVVRN